MPSQPNTGPGDEYLPRVYDALLRKRLSAKGAVLVEGPKWCGKTTTCEPNLGTTVGTLTIREHGLFRLFKTR